MKPNSVDANVAPMMKSVDAAIEIRCCGRGASGTTRRCGGEALMRSVLSQDCRNRLDHDQQVAKRRPRVDVAIVELHPVVEGDVAAAIDLPETGHSLRHAQAAQC